MQSPSRGRPGLNNLQIQAKLQIYLWLGSIKHKKFFPRYRGWWKTDIWKIFDVNEIMSVVYRADSFPPMRSLTRRFQPCLLRLQFSIQRRLQKLVGLATQKWRLCNRVTGRRRMRKERTKDGQKSELTWTGFNSRQRPPGRRYFYPCLCGAP